MSIKHREVITDSQLLFKTTIAFWELISREGLIKEFSEGSQALAKNDFKVKWIEKQAAVFMQSIPEMTQAEAEQAAHKAYCRHFPPTEDQEN